MPELPDITVYINALRMRLLGADLLSIKFNNPFLLRTTFPPVNDFVAKRVTKIERVGKRIAIGFDKQYWLIIHLMIAGRLHWRARSTKSPGKNALLQLTFNTGTLTLTEAGKKRRASVHLYCDDNTLQLINPGGLEPLEISLLAFSQRLQSRNHTLKRALTDPHLLSGIGNAYSDEILHRACLSPVALTQKLDANQLKNLYTATQSVLTQWLTRLTEQTGNDFPEKVTAFRKGMAVHGRFGQSCPICATTVQRIRYASNETNYCPRCQTGGKLLADRALSRLLKKDWPKSIDELGTNTI